MTKRYITDREITFEELRTHTMGSEWVKNNAFMMMEKELKDKMYLDRYTVISDFKRNTLVEPDSKECVTYSLEALTISL